MILSLALQSPLTQHPALMAQNGLLEECGAWNKQGGPSQSETLQGKAWPRPVRSESAELETDPQTQRVMA